MPSFGKVIDIEEKNNEFLAVVKIKGPGTKDFSNPVAKRAKFAAAREAGILSDYIPTNLTEIQKGENINAMMEGKWLGEIETMTILEKGIQQTVLYGIRLKK